MVTFAATQDQIPVARLCMGELMRFSKSQSKIS
jgi:hypothetical protein